MNYLLVLKDFLSLNIVLKIVENCFEIVSVLPQVLIIQLCRFTKDLSKSKVLISFNFKSNQYFPHAKERMEYNLYAVCYHVGKKLNFDHRQNVKFAISGICLMTAGFTKLTRSKSKGQKTLTRKFLKMIISMLTFFFYAKKMFSSSTSS